MNKQNAKDKLLLFFTALLCCALWGSAFPFIKIGYELLGIGENQYNNQILFAGIRFTIAGILVILFGSIISKKILLPDKSSLLKIPILSLFQTILQYIFFYIGLANTTGTKGSIFNSTSVFFAVIISAFIFKNDKITLRKAIGCVIGFAGCVIVNLSSNGLDGGFTLNGEGFILICSLSYAISTVLLKRFSETENPVILSGYQFIFGGIIMSIIGLVLNGRIDLSSIKSILLILYLAFVSAAAYTLWGMLLRKHNVSTVAAFGFMTPVFGCILSALFLNEGLQNNTIKIITALILVSIGIVLVNTNRRKINEG